MISTPKPPDPYETAQAQSGMNRDTAITQQILNMTDQIGPYGNITHTQTGTTGFRDAQGNWIETPRFTQTTTLSPEQERIKKQSEEASFNLSSLANEQTKFLGGYLGKGLDTSSLPGLRSSIGKGFDTNFNRNIGGTHTNQVGQDYTTNLGPDWATSYAGADDFSADRQRYEDALWNRQAGDRQANQDRLRTQLINSGIRPGTAAWDSEMARLSAAESDSRLATLLAGGQEQQRMVGLARDAAQFGNDARLTSASFGNQSELAKMLGQNQASLEQANFAQNAQMLGNQSAAQKAAFENAARAQAMQEMFAQRNQPINEIGALMSGGQVTMPQFGQTPQTGVAGVDYTGLVNQKYQSELQASQAAMGGLFGLGSSLLGMLPFSDKRLKTNIKRVGTTDAGTAIYTYRYKGDDVIHMGVMAQDVPEARVMDPSGYYRVDYSKVS